MDRRHFSGSRFIISYKKKCLKRKIKRGIWCKEWLQKRQTFSHVNLLHELRFAPKDWHNYLRMDEETYLKLLSVVTPLIKKKYTVMRNAISPHETLRLRL
jgi:hypothetical protein